jgi:multidrug resistance efflux pump
MGVPSRVTRWFWSLGLTLVVGSAAGTSWVLKHGTASESVVAGQTGASSSSGGAGLVCYGHVDVDGGVQALAPTQPGRVAAVVVQENQEVEAGTVLIRLEDRPARLRVAEAEAALRSAEERFNEAQKRPQQQLARIAQQEGVIAGVRHQLATANLALTRKQKLERIQQISAEEVIAAAEQVKQLEALEQVERARLAELRLHDPEASVRQAAAELATIRARLEQVRYALDECTLKAPCAGTVLRLHVAVGDLFSERSPQPAVQFCARGARLIRAEVNQEFARRVRRGQTARVDDDVTPGERWRGRVVRVSNWYTHRRSVVQEPFQQNDVRTLECLIALDPDQPPLRIGQRMRVMLNAGD